MPELHGMQPAQNMLLNTWPCPQYEHRTRSKPHLLHHMLQHGDQDAAVPLPLTLQTRGHEGYLHQTRSQEAGGQCAEGHPPLPGLAIFAHNGGPLGRRLGLLQGE